MSILTVAVVLVVCVLILQWRRGGRSQSADAVSLSADAVSNFSTPTSPDQTEQYTNPAMDTAEDAATQDGLSKV